MESPPSYTNTRPNDKEKWGSVLGIIIIVAVLIAGGIYYFVSGQAGQGTQAPAIGAGQA